jgi:hypothetical protein
MYDKLTMDLSPIMNFTQEASHFCYSSRIRPIYNYINFGKINFQLSSSYNMTQVYKDVFPNLHFDNFTYNFSLFKVSNTFFRCLTWSFQVLLKKGISSEYTITNSSKNGGNT